MVGRLRTRQRDQPSAVQAMAEVGVDITREFPKPWTDEIVQAADVVVRRRFRGRTSPPDAVVGG